MKIVEIDYKRLIVLLLPTFLRLPVLSAFLLAFIRPVENMYYRFLRNRDGNIERTNRTGQVCYLRGMLNDLFDPQVRGIRIDALTEGDCVFAYKAETFNTVNKGEVIYLEFRHLKHTILTQSGKIGQLREDFAVVMPLRLKGQVAESRLIVMVNYYKLAGKRFQIVYR